MYLQLFKLLVPFCSRMVHSRAYSHQDHTERKNKWENKRKLKFGAFACKLLNIVPGYFKYAEQCVMVIDKSEIV